MVLDYSIKALRQIAIEARYHLPCGLTTSIGQQLISSKKKDERSLIESLVFAELIAFIVEAHKESAVGS